MVYDYPTISSLSFSIFRSKFMKKANIPRPYGIHLTHASIPYLYAVWLYGMDATGDMYQDIKPGYTGGHVDVYQFHGYNLYSYDINSLYPYIMSKFSFPVGRGFKFEGSRLLKNVFGIVYCRIWAPKDLNIPILLYRDESTKSTLAPLGSWTGWYFSAIRKDGSYGWRVQKCH
jgi:hypothetical protein